MRFLIVRKVCRKGRTFRHRTQKACFLVVPLLSSLTRSPAPLYSDETAILERDQNPIKKVMPHL